ncbi:hypothetical protein A9263_13555 [Vibrio cyclitrophicus]|uniref:hypothetical protein n=1 Tax=Vibrio cyclitrophicus TaxID=47951 RepID=UPI0007EEF4C5|nr:hypothetical protein [Vibrio cyclitrophicus]OBT20108.1 hypothetical protein A9263_13555 [Vibrio cyclitrophicus]
MSESAGTIIKILTALTSVKTCIKYLCVAVALTISWVFVEPWLVSISSIPDEQRSVILAFVGISLGSLIGELISIVYGKIAACIKEKKEANLKIKIDEEKAKAKTLKDEIFLNKFKETFFHLRHSQTSLLQNLTKENQTINLGIKDNIALQENHYIIVISKVTGTDYLVTLNPLLHDFISQDVCNKINRQVDNFLNSKLYDSKRLIEVMTVGNENNMVEPTIFDPLYDHSSSVIYCNINDVHEDEGVWVWFSDSIFDALQEKLGIELIKSQFIPATSFIDGSKA